MSCQLSLLANFQDINSVRKYFFPHVNEIVKREDKFEGWDDTDWGWKDEEDEGDEKSEISGQDPHALSWLQECQVSLSPAADLMAIACDDKLVLLEQKWNSCQEEVQITYQITFQGCVKQEDGENITSLMCLPLASQKRSTQGGPDWTCVIVGFSSGYVRMYTENGALLLSQIFSLEPVQKIKCRTYQPPRHVADAEKHEELSILYIKSLVTIDGFSLFQSLRACRNQVARAAASGSEFVQPPPLAYKKWGLQEQDVVVDHVSCGLQTLNPFDQMHVASMIGGYTASIRSTPPACHLYLTAGVTPYTGFFYAVEGSAQPMLSDVAHAVASKLKSALFSQISAASGWLGFGGRQTPENNKEKTKPKIEPATSLSPRFGLHDKRREGESVVLSPDTNMAAVTDSFGRVMLVDVWRGIVIRMWKGYRDAQVGWVDVQEDVHHEKDCPSLPARHAIFLVIYAPRRGILEVWATQLGPRVAAFNVSKLCRMLCPTYGMMGLNNVTYKDVRVQLHHIYLLDPEGSIRTIDIPFHLVLSDKNSKRARDMHLLKKLKISLKEHNTEGASLQSEVIETLLDMKIASIRQQGLERVLQTKYLSPGFLLIITKAVMKQLENLVSQCEDDEDEVLDYESRALLQFCQAQQHLLNTYMALLNINNDTEDYMITEPNTETLCRVLSLEPDEIHHLCTELDKYQAVTSNRPRVTFVESLELSVYDFLSCFECQMVRYDAGECVADTQTTSSMFDSTTSLRDGTSNSPPGGDTSTGPVGSCTDMIESCEGLSSQRTSAIQVHLQPNLHEAKLSRLANFLFRRSLRHGTSSDYNRSLRESEIPPENLMMLLLHLWLSEDRKSLSDLIPLHSLTKSISCLKDHSDIIIDPDQVSPWWHSMRLICCQATNISSALLAALVGRSVAIEMARCAMRDSQLTSSTGSDKVDLSDWESVTIERTHWTVLIKQLEDLLAVQCLLQMKPTNDGLVNKPTWEPEPITVSVKKVLDGGRGVLPEFVAKWIAGQGVLPSMLCLSQSAEKYEEEPMETDELVKGSSKKSTNSQAAVNPIISQLQEVQHHLPHSLDSDVLMANCTWEYMVLWNKDPEVMFPMEQALAYLTCIQNAVLQHGIAMMLWQMFIVKKLSATAFLIEKVGKAPKDRLCRKEVGLSDVSLNKFIQITVEILEVILVACEDSKEVAILNIEDLWQNVQGPTSLAELALEQKSANLQLVDHHYSLCVILHVILKFNMKSVKPLSLFDSKGRSALFKPLQSTTVLSSRNLDDSLIKARTEFMCCVIGHAVQMLGTRENPVGFHSPSPSNTSSPSTPSHLAATSSPAQTSCPASLTASSSSFIWPGGSNMSYTHWPQLMEKIARNLSVDVDVLRQHHTCQLYSSGLDKMAEEVLLTVTDHAVIGSKLLLICGQRLAHYILVSDPSGSVEKLSKCSTTVSSWLKTLDPSQLHCASVPLDDTAILLGHVVNQLAEGHSEYEMALELIDLIHAL